MTNKERPAWAARLRHERRDRGWSQAHMARQLTQAAAALGITLPERESVLRRIKDWEAGRHKPKDPYPALYARALGMNEEDLFTDSPAGQAPLPFPTAIPVTAPDAVTLANAAAQEMTEFGRWAETTNIGSGTLAYFDDRTRWLARTYLRGRPGPCLQQAADLARRIFHLLQDGHQHHRQTFDLYVIAGKLCALMSPFECGPARQANYTMGVYLRARQTGNALNAAAEADQAWKNGDVWAYGTWAQVRIGSAIAHVMAGEMDQAEHALRPVMDLPAEHRLAPLSARLTGQLTPLLERTPLRRTRQALALREQIREYCFGSAGMTRQLAGGEEEHSW